MREQCEWMAHMAHDLIQTEPTLTLLADRQFTIIFLISIKSKKSNGMNVYGETKKVQEENKWAIPGDCTITFYKPNIEGMTEKQLKILMHHELLHIMPSEDLESFTIRHHDVNDFREIIDRFGLDWAHVNENQLPGQMTLEDMEHIYGKAKEEEQTEASTEEA